MRAGKILWKDNTGEHIINVAFINTPEDGDLVYWSLESLVSKYIYQSKQVVAIREYVNEHLSDTITTVIDDDDHLLVHQFDLAYCFEQLKLGNMIPQKVETNIMKFLNDVPTPTASEQTYNQVTPADDIPFVPPPKEKEEEYEEDEEEVETEAPKRKRIEIEEEEEEGEYYADGDIIGTTMMACKLVNTLLKVIDRPNHDIFIDDRQISDARLFASNLLRSIPRKKILRMCTGEDDEPEDDSPVVTVSSRIVQLGYVVPDPTTPRGNTIMREIGALASRYYKELHYGASPPQVYHTYGSGTRLLISKWTLNTCHETLDRAIHTLMQ